MLSVASVDPVTRCFGSEAVAAIGERGSSNEACLSRETGLSGEKTRRSRKSVIFGSFFRGNILPSAPSSSVILPKNVILFFAPTFFSLIRYSIINPFFRFSPLLPSIVPRIVGKHKKIGRDVKILPHTRHTFRNENRTRTRVHMLGGGERKFTNSTCTCIYIS